MRILYLNSDPGVPLFGTKGASVHVRAMADALANRGHVVAVMAARTDGATERPARFTAFPLPAIPRAGGGGGATVPGECGPIQEGQPLDAVLGAARAFGPDLIYERYALWGRAGVDAARELGIPHVLEVNAPLVHEAREYRGLHDVAAATETAHHVFSRTSLLLAVSSAVAEHACATGARPDRVHLFPNAVDATLFRHALVRPESTPFTMGFCGGLRPWHGLDDLAEIFFRVLDSVPTARLLIVGDGPGRSALQDRLRRHGAGESATFAGAVAHHQVPQWLAQMDVALATYPRLEPFYFSPLKVLEYQAAGLPVVASRQGDLPCMVRHGETGFLYEPGDVAAAAAQVLALGADQALRARIGAAARDEVMGRHTWDDRARELTVLAGSLAPRIGART